MSALHIFSDILVLTEGLIGHKTLVVVFRAKFQKYLCCFYVMLFGSILKVHKSPWMTGQTWVNATEEEGKKKCVCVSVKEREKRDRHISVSVSCNSSQERWAPAPPQHPYSYRHRNVKYRKKKNNSLTICLRPSTIHLIVFKENVSGAWSYKSCQHDVWVLVVVLKIEGGLFLGHHDILVYRDTGINLNQNELEFGNTLFCYPGSGNPT